MSNNQLFNLEKIKELTIPIDELQVKLNQLTKASEVITENIQTIEKEFTDKNYLSQIKIIGELLEKINNKLSRVSKGNLNKFLDFQDRLIRKYKEIFKDNLKALNLNKDIIKAIGLFLIETKKISKIIDFVSFVPSIETPEWLELLDSLKHNSLFLTSIRKTKNYYQNLLRERLNIELSKIPKDTDPIIIKEYEKFFQENPSLTFNDFLRDIENQLTQQELKTQRALIKKVREKEELEKLIKKQEEQKKTYEDYLKLSEREFKRLRRKDSREKLKNVTTESKKMKEIEISDEVSEKIKKFKSQFKKSFEDKYLIQKDEDKDPIDLIRKRKKKKEKEYKQYKDHFENL